MTTGLFVTATKAADFNGKTSCLRKGRIMRINKVLVVLGVALLPFSLTNLVVAQDKATSQEVVAKVKEAASKLSKTGDLAQFNQKQSPWVWKDTYIFAVDCDKKVIAAHPIKPELIGQDIMALKDTKGNTFLGASCEATKKPSGVWVEYWWPKPGEKEGFRKVSYIASAPNTPYVVGAGIYDDKTTVAELEKMTAAK